MTGPSASSSKKLKRTYWECGYGESEIIILILPPIPTYQHDIWQAVILVQLQPQHDIWTKCILILVLILTLTLTSAPFSCVSNASVSSPSKEKSHFLTFLGKGGGRLLQSCNRKLRFPPARPPSGIGAGGGGDKISKTLSQSIDILSTII